MQKINEQFFISFLNTHQTLIFFVFFSIINAFLNDKSPLRILLSVWVGPGSTDQSKRQSLQ